MNREKLFGVLLVIVVVFGIAFQVGVCVFLLFGLEGLFL